jgi:hypothetical protein
MPRLSAVPKLVSATPRFDLRRSLDYQADECLVNAEVTRHVGVFEFCFFKRGFHVAYDVALDVRALVQKIRYHQDHLGGFCNEPHNAFFDVWSVKLQKAWLDAPIHGSNRFSKVHERVVRVFVAAAVSYQ